MIDRGREEDWQAKTQRWSAIKEDMASLEEDARHLARTVGESLREVADTTSKQVRAHPVATLGLAFGAGYVLGGGLPSALTRLAVGAGSRALLNLAVAGLVARLQGVDVDLEQGGTD